MGGYKGCFDEEAVGGGVDAGVDEPTAVGAECGGKGIGVVGIGVGEGGIESDGAFGLAKCTSHVTGVELVFGGGLLLQEDGVRVVGFGEFVVEELSPSEAATSFEALFVEVNGFVEE